MAEALKLCSLMYVHSFSIIFLQPAGNCYSTRHLITLVHGLQIVRPILFTSIS